MTVQGAGPTDMRRHLVQVAPLEKRMAETAEALLDEDERLTIPRPSQELIALPQPLRMPVKAPAIDWHRLLFYVIGGAASLFFLLILAQQINPPDSALRAPAMARILAPWDGTWTGTVTRMDMQGHALESFEVAREYSSTNSTYQAATFRSKPVGSPAEPTIEIWVNQVRGENRLVTRRADTEVTSSPYEGSINGGLLVWTRTTPEAIEVLKTRISGTTLFVEEAHIPSHDPSKGWTASGALTRAAATPK